MLDQALHSSLNFGIETPFLLLILIGLEAVLSADNAIALAAIAQGIEGSKRQRHALNVGLLLAYVLRVTLILTATWVVQFWQFELLGALYLLWLVFNYFTSSEDEENHHHSLRFGSLWQAIPLIAVTDLAFSLDSVTTAIAVADRTWLIIAGGTIGVITLRFLAGLFLRWIEEYTHLEDAGFITVGFVGARLLIKAFNPNIVPPEWLLISAIILMFIWGFSERNELESPPSEDSQIELEAIETREKQKQN
ncbi:MAG: TerC family protein [Prochloraceae cyanobacterium]